MKQLLLNSVIILLLLNFFSSNCNCSFIESSNSVENVSQESTPQEDKENNFLLDTKFYSVNEISTSKLQIEVQKFSKIRYIRLPFRPPIFYNPFI